MKRIVVTILTVSLVLSYNFSQFVVEFNKTYSPDEYAFRKELFDANYTKIQQINNQDLGYKLAVNQMTDWTYLQLQAYLGARFNGTASRSAFPAEQIQVSSLRSTGGFDWRDRGVVSPVKNQGSCGSCWAFGATSVYESFVAIKTGNVYDLSEQFATECTSGSGCNGGYPEDALRNIVSYGMPTEADYPYTSSNAGSATPTTYGICQASNRISVPQPAVRQYTYLSITELRTLLQNSPLAIYFQVQNTFSFYYSGVYSCSTTTSWNSLNHVMMLVGYTADGDWIVKNSWGTMWGINGYAIVTYNIYYDCGIRYIGVQLAGHYIAMAILILMLAL